MLGTVLGSNREKDGGWHSAIKGFVSGTGRGEAGTEGLVHEAWQRPYSAWYFAEGLGAKASYNPFNIPCERDCFYPFPG